LSCKIPELTGLPGSCASKSAVKHIASIQILRAVAAFSVAYGHVAHDAGIIASRQGTQFYAPFAGLSGVGVDLFFAISGFVMMISAAPLFGTPGASRHFFLRRLTRIVPIYWLVTFVYLLAMAVLPGATSSGPPSTLDILRSLFFIPYQRADSGLIQPLYGLGWTLNYEMFFYTLFAGAVLLPIRQAVPAIIGLLLALATLGAVVPFQSAPLRFWTDPIILEFAFGIVVGVVFLSGWRPGRTVGFCMLVVGIALFAWLNRSGDIPGGWGRALMAGLPLALVMAGALFAFPGPLPRLRLLSAVGDASYALYLFHPMVIRSLSILWGRSGFASGWLYVGTALVLCIGLALALYRFFERPVTRYLQRHVR